MKQTSRADIGDRVASFYPILSGLAFGVAWNVQGAAILMIIALVPMFLFLHRNELSVRRAFIGGMTFGVIAFGSTITYFFRTVPLSWMGIPGTVASYAVVGVVWLLSLIVMSIGPAVWASLYRGSRRSDISDIVLASSLWVALEYVRSTVFLMVWSGPGGLVGPYWTNGFIGIAMADIPFFLPLAAWGGVMMLGFVVVGSNAAIAWIIGRFGSDNRGRDEGIAAVASLVVLVSVSYVSSLVTTHVSERNMRVGLVSTNESRLSDMSRMSRLETYLEIRSMLDQLRKADDMPDLLIFPEDSGFMEYLGPAERRMLFSPVGDGEPTYVVDSRLIATDDGSYVELSRYTGGVDDGIPYVKRLIVPFGEYVPSLLRFTVGRSGWSEATERYFRRKNYRAGRAEAPLAMGEFRGVRIASLLCSEMLTDRFYRQAVREGAGILTNSASHSWFHGSPALFRETVRRAKLFSVSHHRYFLFSGNETTSFIVAPSGELQEMSAVGRTTIVVGDVSAFSDLTPYDATGNIADVLMVVPAVFLLGLRNGRMCAKMIR